MIASPKFDMDRCCGQEALNLKNYKGCFALADSLKPRLMGGTLTIACVGPCDAPVMVGGLLAVLTGRKIEFMFCTASDPNYCKADFVVMHSKKNSLFGGDNDPWEVILGIAWNTPWVAELFACPQGRDEFLQDLWDASYEGLVKIQQAGILANHGDRNIAVKGLMYMTQRFSDSLKCAKGISVIMTKLQELVQDADGVIVAPANAQGWGAFYVLRYILSLEQHMEPSTHKRTVAVIVKERHRWTIYPGLTTSDEGTDIPCISFSKMIGDNPKETLKKVGAWMKGPNISCGDKQSAVVISNFLRDVFYERVTNKTLSQVLEESNGEA